MSTKKSLEFDMIAGSQLRDTQGEMLSIEGADISHLEQGLGLINDNHGKGAFNVLGRITSAKKIFKAEDCENERQTYYWEKIKAPYIYVRGYMFDNEDHPNARAAAAILRNIHKEDCPLKLKSSVEGGVIARGIRDESLLARTKITKVALTFTPANNATLVEPLGLEKTSHDWESDLRLIKSVMHLAQTDVPSFRHITRYASAEKVADNIQKINEMAHSLNFKTKVPSFTTDDLVKQSVFHKLNENINKINILTKKLPSADMYHIHQGGYQITKNPISLGEIDKRHGGVKKLEGSGFKVVPAKLVKALTAGYGGAGAPTGQTGGGVLQSESLDLGGRGFKYITCDDCGDEGVYMKHQVKCRKCGKSYPMSKLYRYITSNQ